VHWGRLCLVWGVAIRNCHRAGRVRTGKWTLPAICENGMDVESHSEGFKFKYGRYPKWDEEENFCDEFWFDPIFRKIPELVKQRTGK